MLPLTPPVPPLLQIIYFFFINTGSDKWYLLEITPNDSATQLPSNPGTPEMREGEDKACIGNEEGVYSRMDRNE
jgi:hypothetical protein